MMRISKEVILRRLSPAALVTLVWVSTAILVNPVGEFPLNDDWAYAWSVKVLLEQGTFRLSDWTATNLAPQVVWGTLFCMPFGFSFTALRVSTLVAGLAGLLATAGVLKETGGDRGAALLGLLAIAFNPLYLALSSSFNSDVPSFALFATALYCITRGCVRQSQRFGLLGVGVAIVAVLQRQSNLLLLPSAGVAYLMSARKSPQTLVVAGVPTLLGLAAQFSYSHWLTVSGRRPLLYGLQVDGLVASVSRGPEAIAQTYAWNLVVILLYVGLFLFPVLMAAWVQRVRTLTPGMQIAALVSTLMLTAVGVSLLGAERMPLMGNVLHRTGVGPLELEPLESSMDSAALARLTSVWQSLTILAVLGGVLLSQLVAIAARRVLQARCRHTDVCLTALVLSATALFFAGVGGLPRHLWFDRYLIPFLPLVITLTALSGGRPGEEHVRKSTFTLTIGLIVIALMGAFSVPAVHDYLAMNRARVDVLDQAVGRFLVQPSEVDSGWEIAGWRFGNRIDTCNPGFDRANGLEARWEDFTCLYRGAQQAYGMSCRRRQDNHIVSQVSFRRWLPWRLDTVSLVRR